MAFTPVETALYVTLRALTRFGALALQATDQPEISARKINHGFQQHDHFRKQEILGFTAPPSSLAPYQQIIYKFSENLENQFLTSDGPATDILHDALAMKYSSGTMIALQKEQLRFLSYIEEFIDYCMRSNTHDAIAQTYVWRQRIPLISNIFDDSKSSITGQEYTVMLDMAREADDLKNRFTRVNSLYLPK